MIPSSYSSWEERELVSSVANVPTEEKKNHVPILCERAPQKHIFNLHTSAYIYYTINAVSFITL